VACPVDSYEHRKNKSPLSIVVNKRNAEFFRIPRIALFLVPPWMDRMPDGAVRTYLERSRRVTAEACSRGMRSANSSTRCSNLLSSSFSMVAVPSPSPGSEVARVLAAEGLTRRTLVGLGEAHGRASEAQSE
jgi:hypothetical protein